MGPVRERDRVSVESALCLLRGDRRAGGQLLTSRLTHHPSRKHLRSHHLLHLHLHHHIPFLPHLWSHRHARWRRSCSVRHRPARVDPGLRLEPHPSSRGQTGHHHHRHHPAWRRRMRWCPVRCPARGRSSGRRHPSREGHPVGRLLLLGGDLVRGWMKCVRVGAVWVVMRRKLRWMLWLGRRWTRLRRGWWT